MTQTFNLGQIILAAAQQHPDRIAFLTPGGIVTYERLRELILNYASRMRALGVDRSSRVCFTVVNPIPQISAALACALLGCSWIHGNKAAVGNRKLGITHVLHTEAQAPPDIGRPLRLDPSWGVSQPVDEKSFEGFESPDSIWFVAQSSGTTGESKFMLTSAVAQYRRMARTTFEYLGDAPPVICSLMHPLSVFGMAFVLKSLMIARPVVISDDLDFIQSAGVNTVIGSPAQHLSLCEGSRPSPAKIACAVVGGAHCSEQLFDRLFERFEMVQYHFGCSELGRIAINRFRQHAEDRRSVGKPVASAEFQIVDEDGRPLPPRAVGVLRMRSDGPITGYIGGDTVAPFRDGWFYSGDIGFISEDGALTITGRANDVINFGGTKLSANALDDVIAAADGVKEGVCFLQSGVSAVDELAVLIVPRDGHEAKAVVQGLQAALSAKFGRSVRKIYIVSAIPKSENGKIARYALTQLVADRVPFTMS